MFFWKERMPNPVIKWAIQYSISILCVNYQHAIILSVEYCYIDKREVEDHTHTVRSFLVEFRFIWLISLYCKALCDLKSGLGIRSFAHSLISLKSNERLWAIRSDRSRQMSDRERIAQVSQRKWVNEQFAQKKLAKKSKILFLVWFIYN